MNITLTGKRALVTGASAGIGYAIASALAAAGAKVAVNYRTHPAETKEKVRAIQQSLGEAIALQGDISKPADVKRMFRQMDSKWGGIDILVNNAGVDGERAMTWEADLPKWRKVIEVNLFGAFYCSREALQRMTVRKWGVIINISSVHEEIAWSGYSAYTASKAALAMLTKTMAQEAAASKVRVVAIAPGAIKTRINKAVWSKPRGLNDLLEKIPLKRLGEPEDVAQMVVVLASDIASYITGRTVFVDGGMTDYPSFVEGG